MVTMKISRVVDIMKIVFICGCQGWGAGMGAEGGLGVWDQEMQSIIKQGATV